MSTKIPRRKYQVYSATIYAIGAPQRLEVFVTAATYNQAKRIIESKPEFKRWGKRPRPFHQEEKFFAGI